VGRGRGAAGAAPRARQSSGTPLVVDGVMYLSTAYNRVVALDPETGREIWVKDVGNGIAIKGIAYWPGEANQPPRLVFGTADGSAWLIALNATTGEFVAGFGENGRVNLRQGVGEKFPDLRVALSSPPAIYRHLAITGQHSQESPSKGPAGDVRAWDLRTGKLVWTFHTIPRPGEANHEAWQGDQWVDRAGANSWGLMTVDEKRGIVYVPLGTPATDFYGGDRLGSNLYGSTLVALDAATGKLKWHFQTTHHDNWDYDLTSPPALIDVKRGGRTIPAVAQYTKQGLLFIFNRETGEPIFGVEERPVLSDNPIEGDVYSPTQPFPVKPVPLARMTFSPEEVATVTPAHEQYCRDLLKLEGGVMTGGPYAQYGPRLRVIFPGWTGGGNWNGGAFNPGLGYLFLPSQDVGMLNKMVKSTRTANMYSRVGPDEAPPDLAGNFWDGRKSWPCQQPPWGELLAVNVNTGDIAWRVPLGSFEELDKLGVPPTGTPLRGGPIATAGGLVFIASSVDARFRAFDARTGQVLWTADLTENGRAVPMTYQGKSGRQYVAIMAGGGRPVARSIDPSGLGGRLHVYALPDGKATPQPRAGITPPAGATPPAAATPAQAPASAGQGQRPAAPAGGSNDQRRDPPAATASAITAGTEASGTFPLPEGPARPLVQRMCAGCHALEVVLKATRSRDKWEEVVDNMVARGAKGTDEEIEQVIEYLARHFAPR
jgi:quinoprotein glucose dehydrogenase